MIPDKTDETLAETCQKAIAIVEGDALRTHPELVKDGRDWEILVVLAHRDGKGGAHLYASCNVEHPGDIQLAAAFLGRLGQNRREVPDTKTRKM